MRRNETYLTTITANSKLQEKATELAQGNYDTPLAIYEITVPTFFEMMALLDEEMEDMTELSDALLAYLNTRSHLPVYL